MCSGLARHTLLTPKCAWEEANEFRGLFRQGFLTPDETPLKPAHEALNRENVQNLLETLDSNASLPRYLLPAGHTRQGRAGLRPGPLVPNHRAGIQVPLMGCINKYRRSKSRNMYGAV